MKKGQASDLANIALFTQLGLSVICPILICGGIALWLKNRGDVKEIWIVLLILLGLSSGLYSAYKLIRRMVKLSSKNDSEDDYGA